MGGEGAGSVTPSPAPPNPAAGSLCPPGGDVTPRLRGRLVPRRDRSLPASAAPGGRRGVSKGGNGVGRYVLVLLESGPGLRGFSAAALEMIIFSFWRV